MNPAARSHIESRMQANRPQDFRELCQRHGLSLTHQREVIYNSLMASPGHPSPEEVFEVVRKQIPSISLATVYKTLHTFVESGMLRELSLHHGSLRVDTNTHPHHHAVCTRCKAVFDLDSSEVEPAKVLGKLPRGFQLQNVSVEIHGLCRQCSRDSHQ